MPCCFKKIFFVFLYLISLWCSVSIAQSSDEGKTIVDFEVKGNAKVEADAILIQLKSQKGKTFDPNLIKEDIKAIFDLKFFSQVNVYSEPGAEKGTLKLIYEVVEKPAIIKISFSGFKRAGRR